MNQDKLSKLNVTRHVYYKYYEGEDKWAMRKRTAERNKSVEYKEDIISNRL